MGKTYRLCKLFCIFGFHRGLLTIFLLYRFLPELKSKCLNSTPGNKEFWSEVQTEGRALSLISDKEAKKNGGSSNASEDDAVKVCVYMPSHSRTNFFIHLRSFWIEQRLSYGLSCVLHK